MEAVAEQLETWPDQTMAARQETIVNVRRFVLAAMESGNPSAAVTILRELAEYDAQAAFSLRAEVVGAYGMDI